MCWANRRSNVRLSLAVLAVVLAGRGGGYAPLWAAEPRDPFAFGSQRGAPVDAPVLVGILWDAVEPLAIVDERSVTVGQTVFGWQVVEIRPSDIVIERAGIRQTLAPGSFFPSE